MIGVKEAVKTALDYVQELYGPTFSDFLLEEAEPTEDGLYWLITVGFSRSVRQKTSIAEMLAPKEERLYKIVKVDATSGEPISVKIREV